MFPYLAGFKWFDSNSQSQICLEKVTWILTNSNWKRILVKTERHGIRHLCEELSDAWQQDLAYESRAWIEAELHLNEYDQMDVWG